MRNAFLRLVQGGHDSGWLPVIPCSLAVDLDIFVGSRLRGYDVTNEASARTPAKTINGLGLRSRRAALRRWRRMMRRRGLGVMSGRGLMIRPAVLWLRRCVPTMLRFGRCIAAVLWFRRRIIRMSRP
jgi:hypothetical protein